ncbi:MAG TPA: hypothetical protein VMV90_06175 [Rectinemataceae bacterium]|nr:hypothetical protein [Rectinemataceae bacterium]
MRRLTRALVVLSLAAATRLPLAAQAPGFPYRLELSPAHPVAGGEVQLDLIVRGLSPNGLELSGISVDPALSLESQITEPYVESDGARAARARLVFRALAPGRAEIRRLVLGSKEGSLVVGPVSIVIGASGGDSGSREEPWVWEAPSSVHRYESFTVSLKPVSESGQPRSVAASFSAPSGASLEASGALSWTMTALGEGRLALPEALLGEGGAVVGRAPGREIGVLPLPAAVAASRAIGSFELSLDGLVGLKPRAGGPFVFRLTLSGRGDLPGLRLPEPELSLDGRPLGAEYLASRRIDDSRPGKGGYEGRAELELTVTPPAPGRLRISVPPFVFLDPAGDLSRLSVAPVSLAVAPAAAAGAVSARLFVGAEAAAAALAASRPALRGLGELYLKVRPGRSSSAAARREALALLSGASGRDARYLEAALCWDGGERGRALALLYGIMRRYIGSSAAARAAAACSGELGSGPPLLDALPPPMPFELAGFFLLALALAFAARSAALRLASRRASRRIAPVSGEAGSPRRPPALSAAVLLAAALALLCFGAAGVSALERQSRYAVVWTENLILVPSTLARAKVEVIRGSAARVRGLTAAYVGLELADGLSGWAPKKYVYYY